MRKIKMTIGQKTIHAECYDTPTAEAILAALPFETRVSTWGEEVYFTAPVRAEVEPNARDVVDAGELAYRAEGEAIVIGFGPTPVSQGDEIRLARAANVWGRSVEDVRCLRDIEPGTQIRVEATE